MEIWKVLWLKFYSELNIIAIVLINMHTCNYSVWLGYTSWDLYLRPSLGAHSGECSTRPASHSQHFSICCLGCWRCSAALCTGAQCTGNIAISIFRETNELSLQALSGMSHYHRADYDINQKSLLGSGPVTGTLKQQCRTGRLWV